ncbi:MAG: S-layer homology domain-containing protein [Clostridia bacterium]|nr:S-layer homology domain-containing protein [Clostridia bacterium]
MKKALSALIAIVMLAAALAASIPASAKGLFSDVDDGRWSASSITYAVNNGYMNGVGDDKFDPSGPLTRAMVATVLWRREGSPAPAAPSGFEDVPDGKWYTDAVAWAKETGIVNGLTDKTFGPNSYITREQLGTMLFRFSATAPVSVPERADLSSFDDDEKVSGWADEAMKWAVEAGLINGTGGNKLAPDGKATREQFAAIIERYDNTFKLKYNTPVIRSHYTEKEYPLVEDADIYVATDGDDGNPGTFDKPLATFAGAVAKVREIKASKTEGDIVVAFKAGNYGPLCVELTAEDSGTAEQRIVYCKYGDGDVVFDNGLTVGAGEFVPISEDERSLFSEKAADKIKKADVTGRLDGYVITDLVLSDDGEMTVARFPNRFEDGTDHLIRGGHTVDESHISIYNSVFKNRIKNYASTEGLYLYGFITLGWYKDIIETDECTVDPESGDPVFHVIGLEKTRGGNLRFGEGFEKLYYQMALVNIFEELDAKDEFIFSRDKNTLYVYDPDSDMVFVNGGDMISMDHADYISFIGLTLKNSKGRMINATVSHDVTFDRCAVSGSASKSALFFGNCELGRDFNIRILNSEFSMTAAYAVDVCYSNVPDSGRNGGKKFGELIDTANGVVIDNNLFTKSSLVIGNTGAVGVDVTAPVVTHNVFYKCCWCGLDYSGTINMLAAYNVFDQVCFNGDDTGALNTWYSTDYCGNVIRNNLFVNVPVYGLYLDDVVGNRVESNIFYEVGTTSVNNGICRYNTFCDNALIYPGRDGGSGCGFKVYGSEAVEEAMKDNDDPSVLTSVGDWGRWNNTLKYYYDNPEVLERAREMWPDYFEITTDVTRWQEKNYCSYNSLVITGNREINEAGEAYEYPEILAKYSTIENNVGIPTDENPLFVNPTLGDYRLREDAGIPDLEFEKIGRY